MNMIADQILDLLLTKHDRVYRNKPSQKPVCPYIVFYCNNSYDNYPSTQVVLNIDIFDDANVSIRAVEDMADEINNMLNHKVFMTDNLNMQFELEARQMVSPEDLIDKQMVNLRYEITVYFKK